jgi:TonB-linked outer membrane protein, SusC/RagA family
MNVRKKSLCLLALFAWLTPALTSHVSTITAQNTSTQQKKESISGKVKDTKGETLIGVSVKIKGSNVGTITDATGSFILKNVPSSATLEFSYIGMNPIEVAVGNRTSINVTLEEKTVGMNEVVVVGFGTQKKVNLTGSVSTVDAKALEARPVQNAVQSLEGMVAGLNISQNQGMLESKPSVNVRGLATIGTGSSGSPLILIDGMEGDLSAINPQDIENISVLKDAAASSIYGSRAPFGVILVTTKKGKQGKISINYSNNFKSSSPVLMPHMMDSYTFALYFNEASKNSGSSPFFDDAWLKRIKDFQDGKLIGSNGLPITSVPNGSHWADYGGGNDNIDWYKAVYKSSAPSQEHNFSVSGGNESTKYYFSGNYLDQDGLMRFGGDHFYRYTATGKIETKLAPWVTLGYNTRWIRQDYQRPSSLGDGLFSDLARQGWPILPLYDPNGYLFSSPSPALALRDGGRDKTQEDWLYQQAKIVLEPVKGWITTGEFNYKTDDQFRHWDTQKTYNHDVNGNPYAYNSYSSVHEGAYRTNYYDINLFSEYTKEMKGGHTIKGMLGLQSEMNQYRDLTADRQGIIVADLPTLNTTSGVDANGKTAAPSVSGNYYNWSTAGFFGRLNYNYQGKYLLEANMRYDGSSRFQADKRWHWFPSFSAGWNIARESFWKPLEDYVSTLKLRASYGSLGNQNTIDDNGNIRPYPTYLTMPVGTANGSWLINGAQPNTSSIPPIISSSLNWEKIRTWNAGLDVAALNNRLNISLDCYIRYTNDMMGDGVELPATLGTGVPKTNNTDLKTQGFELEVSWKDRLANGLGYGIKVLLSNSTSKITRYANPTGTLDKYYAGETYGEIWGYTTKGIAKSDDEMNAHLATLANGGQNALGSNWKAGDIMYADINGDGKIDNGANTVSNHGDLKVIGNKTPKLPFGVELTADWKGFDFRAFFQGVMKRDYFADSYFFWGAWKWGIWWSTGLKEQLDYFRGDANNPLGQNLNSYYPRPLFGDGKNQQCQTKYLLNAAYVRLKNLQLGYTLPRTITERVGIHKLRVYVSGENLLTFTNMPKMFDPETVDGGVSWMVGNAYPLSRVFSGGLSVNF